MTSVWFAAFALLFLFAAVNAIVTVALMRQIGVLHQRLLPTGPGTHEGPLPGTVFTHPGFETLSGPSNVAAFEMPITILGYVTPGCGLCEPLPGFLSSYAKTAPSGLHDIAVITDAPDAEARTILEKGDLSSGVAFLRHDAVARHYGFPGSPYVAAFQCIGPHEGVMLFGGIVNTLEQLEDLVDESLSRHSRTGEEPEELSAQEKAARVLAATGSTNGKGMFNDDKP